MTLNDFIAWIEAHRDQLSGDETMAVGASGGLGAHGHAVESVSLGFDWDRGKLMFHTKTPLCLDGNAIRRAREAKEKHAGTSKNPDSGSP